MPALEVPKRGKGRPRKDIDTSVKTQREKNRKAQSIFRARKRATEAANELRISQLENTVERMGDAFLELVNHVIQASQTHKDSHLTGRLQESIHTFLVLASASYSSDQRWDSPSTGNQGDIHQPTPHEVETPVTEEVAAPAAVMIDASSSQQVLDLSSWNSQDSGNLWSLLDQFGSPPSLLPQLTGPPTNVLGNGWTRDLPFSYTATIGEAVGHPVAQSMSTLLIQATLYYVYYILLEATDLTFSDAAKEIFRYALKLHSRDEILFNLRWFLGPGQREAYRLGITRFQLLNAQDHEHFPTLSPAVDSDALGDIQAPKLHTSNLRRTLLLNASGVESYLQQHGVRRITGDILEIDLGQREDYREAQLGTTVPFNPNLINADVFFPAVSQGGRAATIPAQQDSTPRIVRFSESSFMRFLATQASHCLAYGPAYQKDRLPDLIEAASVPSR